MTTSATQILRDEHDTILEMIGTLEAVVQRIEAGEPVALETLSGFTEFFVLFADRSHHGKEEDLLFPFLECKGVPRNGGPLGCMLAEHDEGRTFIRAMKENAEGCAGGGERARRLWCNAARSFATLLRKHIWKENQILFQIAEKLLSAEEQAELAVRFKQVQAEKLDAPTLARLEQKKRTIEQKFALARSKAG